MKRHGVVVAVGMTVDLKPFGVWRRTDLATPELAVELERLGYGTLWLGGSPGGDLAVVDELLAATSTLTVATGIVNVWNDDAAAIGAAYHRIADRFGDRFLLGVGVGHREATAEYAHPYRALVRYLDGLDAAGVPRQRTVLAALGPKVLELARDRTAGAHPYLTTPEHTKQARGILGDGPLLVPEHKVVVEPDDARGREIGRPAVQFPYLGMENYRNSLRRLGFTDADLDDGGSDRLIDAVALHGDADRVAAGLREHLAAGADQVAVQVVTAGATDPVPSFRALAEALDLP